MGGVKEVIEVKAVCFANHRRSSVSLNNTEQVCHYALGSAACLGKNSFNSLLWMVLSSVSLDNTTQARISQIKNKASLLSKEALFAL